MFSSDEVAAIRAVVADNLPDYSKTFSLKVNGAIDMVGVILAEPLGESHRKRLNLALHNCSQDIGKQFQFYIQA